jgi:hypothetical protein
MPIGRPPFSFALIDLPSDHEVANRLATECETISAILHNRGLGTRVKLVRATSKQDWRQIGKSYDGLGFVHLSTHGTPGGIGLIGTCASWSFVEDKLRGFAPPLRKRQQRVLCLSCCYSKTGADALADGLAGRYTGIYYFGSKRIGFATSMTVWNMFYMKKTIEKPTAKVLASINDFFGEKILRFRSL